MNKPIILTIAGFDPSSGAGITADLRTFHNLNCFGAAVITAVTYQNTVEVNGFTSLSSAAVNAQFKAIADDYNIKAVKIGMLASDDIAETVSEIAAGLAEGNIPIIIDPVYRSGNGISLYNGNWDISFRKLIPSATLLTPNIHELARLTGKQSVVDTGQLRKTAKILYTKTGVPILATGGHIESDKVIDVLVEASGEAEFEGQPIDYEVHGTGCLLSAAITAYMAKGLTLYEAVNNAQDYVDVAIGNPLKPGRGQAIPGEPNRGRE